MITKHDNNDNKNDNMITRLVTGNTKIRSLERNIAIVIFHKMCGYKNSRFSSISSSVYRNTPSPKLDNSCQSVHDLSANEIEGSHL